MYPLLFHMYIEGLPRWRTEEGRASLPCHASQNLSDLMYTITKQLLIDGRLSLAAKVFTSMYQ
jgi:hypothetical protein